MSHREDRSLPPELRSRLDEELPAERARLERVWQLIEGAEPPAEPPATDAAWDAMERQLEAKTTEAPADTSSQASLHRRRNGRAPLRNRRRRMPKWIIAMALAVLLLVGAFWLWQRPVRVVVPPGEQAVVTMPDGSTVELNSGTTLTYHWGFAVVPFAPAERREVHLRGEAFFEVTEGARPFVVETFNARIRVLGTRFNVRARPEAPARATQVTLAEGRVRLAARQQTGQAVTLERRGQAARVAGRDAAPTPPHETSLGRVLTWRSDGFAITGQPLPVVLAELERRYDTRLVLRGDTADAEPLTLYYPQAVRLETILQDICVARGLRYRAVSRGYEIFRTGS